MASGSYKKWSKEERERSYRLTVKAEFLGWIKKRDKCQCCGQEQGIIQLHNEDYDITFNTLFEVFKRVPVEITDLEKLAINEVLFVWCWRCHMIHHSQHRNKAACDEYFAAVKSGIVYPPVYKHDFGVLRRDHGIN